MSTTPTEVTKPARRSADSDAQPPAKKTENNPHKSLVVYAIAIITLGAAFGNMFLAGKVKRVMNVKIPHFDADSSYRKFQQQAAQEQMRRAAQQANRARQNRDGSKFNYQEEFSRNRQQNPDGSGPVSSWSYHDTNLNTLGLKRHQCDEASIKKAFFTLAKQNHPDTLPQDITPHEKELRVKKFQQINQAYQELMQFVKLMDQAGTHP